MFKTVALFGTFCSIGYYIFCLWAARRFLGRRAVAAAEFTPPVSILKPLSGSDPQLYDSLRSHCVQDYPRFEMILGVSDPGDSAVPVVERLMREFPERAIRLVLCPNVLGTNPKISNLIQMLADAGHDYVLVNDGDIRVRPDYLRRVMVPFCDPRVGMVTCLYRGIGGTTLGSRLEAAGIGTSFAGGVLASLYLEGGLRFGLGATLALRRDALGAIGGLAPLVDHLADDFELGRRIAHAGFKIVLSDIVVEHFLPEYSLRGFLRHQLRWARGTRACRPGGYLGIVLTFGLPWALLAAALLPRAVWGWGLFSFVLILRLGAAVALRLAVLKDRRTLRELWLVPISDFFAVAVWLWSYAGRRVFWRGHEFRLEGGKLRPI